MADVDNDTALKTITEVVVVRHGLTDANARGVMQGHYDSHLEPMGVEQAQMLAERLNEERFDAVYSSDLTRTMHTAQILVGNQDYAIVPTPGLREWALGVLENLSYEEGRRVYPEIMEAFLYDAEDIIIPEGESKKQFYERIGVCFEELAARHDGGRVLLVTHGGALQAILKFVLGVENSWQFLPRSSNTSYNKFICRGGCWQLCCWNDTSHLTEETSEI